jgi:DNA ligase-1
LISEKLDGVRAWWDGKNFISRLGNIYHAPDWFKEDLPSSALDGELWMGRKMFQKCISIVRRQDKSEHWKEIEYVIFDAPTATGVFTERIECVEVYFRAREKEKKRKLKHMSYLDHKPCTGIKHLKKQLSIIEGYGGEGLMLRDPNSLYVAGRSNTLLKVKSSFEDDATVVSYEAGKGKHEGRVGALNVKLANGIEFALGTGLSDSEREHPPAVGTVVTFRYTELTDEGVPRFARFLRVHVDV